MRRACKSAVDRTERCYRCGAKGHRARDCSARVPMCLVCTALGLPASHRMGSPACKPPARKKRAAQKARTVPGDGGDAATRKKTMPPSTGPMKARKEDGEVGMHRLRREPPGGGYGNGAFPDVSGRRGEGQLLLQCNLNRAR